MSDEMDEIWALFADDGGQSLDAMEEALLALQDGEGDQTEHVSALFRAVHTFKGNSRVLGLAVVESRAHLAEDLIGLVRDDGVPLDEGILEVLLYAGDVLRNMLEETAANRADVDPAPSEDLNNQLKATIARCTGQEIPEPEETAAPAETAEDESEEAEPADDAPAEDAEEAAEEAAGDDAPAESPAAPPAGLMDAFSMLGELAADDDGSSSGNDDYDIFEDKGEGVPVSEDEPEPEPAPEPAAEGDGPQMVAIDSGGTGGMTAVVEAVAAPPPKSSRLEEPGYREIFSNMVNDTVDKLTSLIQTPRDTAEATLKVAWGKVDSLAYAAEQMGLDDWSETLGEFVSAAKANDAPTAEGVAEDIASVTETIQKKLAEVFGEGGGQTDLANDMPGMFEALQGIFQEVSAMGLKMAGDEQPSDADQKDLAQRIIDIAEPTGCVRVVEAAENLGKARNHEDFRAAELKFYEELAAIEAVLPEGSVSVETLPSAVLATWCADHIFDTLSQIRDVLDNIRARGDDRSRNFRRFERLMRLSYHASRHYQMDTAAQLTMALIDLFSRVELGGAEPDGLLTHIARGFVDTMELVFDALDQGDTPDTAMIEKLFEEASNACFASSGLVTARTIEKRLGLPKSFHRVLSPESVKVAVECIENNNNFFVLRADLNEDDELAEKFLEWVSSGQATMITNVTVFQDDKTIFDFLIATTLDESQLTEVVVLMCPKMDNLRLQIALEVQELEEEDEEGADTAGPAQDMGGGISTTQTLAMLETIGEISAGQSMVQHMLADLCSADLMHELDTAVRDAAIPAFDLKQRRVLRDVLEAFSLKLQQVSEAEAQLSEQLNMLQEESVAMRSRPADVLLKPLGAFVETESRKYGREVRLSSEGGDTMLDQHVMEELRGLLRSIITLRLRSDEPCTKLHASVHREEDRVSIILEDDSSAAVEGERWDEVRKVIKKKNGEFRAVTLPGGGMRFYLAMLLQMVVLDGMVVRVRDVRYVVPIDSILRIQQGDGPSIKKISAERGQKILRIGKDEHVPIRALAGSLNASDNDDTAPEGDAKKIYVIVRNSVQQLAIPVDELLGQQLVLLRPLRGVLSRTRDLTGVALLAGGEVGMVLAVSRLRAA